MRLLPMVLVAASITAGCTFTPEIATTEFRHVSLAKARADEAEWKLVEEDLKAGRPVVIDVDAGQSLPVMIGASSPVVDLKVDRAELVFSRAVHVLIKDGALMVSPDGVRWAEIQDRRSMGVLFGIKQGKVEMGLTVSQKDGAVAVVDIEAK